MTQPQRSEISRLGADTPSSPDIVWELIALADGSFNFTSSEHEVLRRARDQLEQYKAALIKIADGKNFGSPLQAIAAAALRAPPVR